jgi:hypothetical protein
MKNKSKLQERIEKLESYPDDTLFYWVSYCYENRVRFWNLVNNGSTDDIDKAQLYTKEQTLLRIKRFGSNLDFYPQHEVEKAIYRIVDGNLIENKI